MISDAIILPLAEYKVSCIIDFASTREYDLGKMGDLKRKGRKASMKVKPFASRAAIADGAHE